MLLENSHIKLLKKIHSFKVAVAAKLIWSPFSRLTAIVQIEHVGYCINTQAINMVLLQPEHSIGNQEALYLSTAIVKVSGTPTSIVRKLAVVRLI